MKVSGIQLASSLSVLTSTDSRTLVADNIHTQQPQTATKTFPTTVPVTGFKKLNFKSLSSKSNPVISTVNPGVSIAQIPNKDENRFVSLISALKSSQQPKQNNSTSDKQQRTLANSGQQSEKRVVSPSAEKNASVPKGTFSLSSLRQPITPVKKPETQLPTVLQTALRDVGSAKLLEVESCSQEKGELASLLLTSKACQQHNFAQKLVAQNNNITPDTASPPETAGSEVNPIQPATATPAGSEANPIQPATVTPETSNSVPTQTQPATLTPAGSEANPIQPATVTPAGSETNPIQPATVTPETGNSVPTQTQPATVTPETGNSVPTQTQPATVTPAPGHGVEIPNNLNSNPNPLQFPTKPEEVTFQGNQPITLAQALELARRNNRDLQVSLLELQRAQAALREAQAALLPNVGVTAELTRSQAASTQLQVEQGVAPPTSDDPTTSFNGQAQLTYNIYTSGNRRASIRQAEEQVRFNELAVESQSEQIRLNVTTDYYNLQQRDEEVRIAQSAVENSQASLRDAQALETAGVGTRFDVLRSQVNLANAQQDLTNAFAQQQIARRQLATRISLPQSINISAADPVQLAGIWNQTLEQSIVLAFQNRAELQQQLAQRNIYEQQRRQALSSLGPQVSLVASYQLLDQFNDNTSATDGYSLGVRATLNLYDGGAAKARAAQAKANIAIAETQFAEQRNQIRFQVEQAFSTQQARLENVQTANTALEQAREALRLARLRFQAGVGTQTDVINSENDLTTAEGNRVRAILDYNRALADLQRAISSRATP
ncbi:TolC family protein [Nostoc sp. CENA67]|uniref:TolC family protein n=2 Tax=Amazonocrinis TaxID=2840440 RepID=A0A8J7L664_9NOST|nr:TolC family protein [Amazonocrinis nigriterrae CENA67]